MATFSVAARTLVHLGAELITSDEVAVNELVKNAFDAESARVKIVINHPVQYTVIAHELERLRPIKSKLKLTVEVAKTCEILVDAVGALPAGPMRAEVEKKITHLRGVATYAEAKRLLESINYLSIEDAGVGMSKKTLESVFLTIGTPSKLNTQLAGQSHRKVLGNKGIGRLAMMRLGGAAQVITWQSKSVAHRIKFDWRLFDDPTKSIGDIPLGVVRTVPPRTTETGTVIIISALKNDWTEDRVRTELVGQFLRRLQSPFATVKTEQDLVSFPIDVHFNGGNRLPIEGMKKVLTDLVQIDFELNFDPSGVDGVSGRMLETKLIDYQRGKEPEVTHRNVTEMTTKLETDQDSLDNIGPFKAMIRWFNRDKLRQQSTLHGNWKAAKQELDLWSGGIAIYRDGFRVGFSGQSTGEDWLGLDSSALKRGGFAVNRIQVVGALDITRAENPNLIDRSNREGLIDSRETMLVREILTKFAVDELRRYIDKEGRLEKKAELDELVENAPVTILSRINQAEQGLSDIRSKVPDDAKQTVQSISKHLHFIRNEVKKFENASKQAGERREDILELAGVGTVMSGVLHELTRTTGHTRELLKKLSKDESPQTKALLQKLDAEIKAINTRLRQLDPLTPSGRHRKEEFDLMALLSTIVEGYAARFERHHIHCHLAIADEVGLRPVKVNMVRGFVSLAIENLITNSIYWLKQISKSASDELSISLDYDPVAKTLSIRDNGPGISPADKDRIFTAGFSMRPRGQGLGLFIAAEVATYHNAQLALDSADEDGRYRCFVLELPRD
ncbi:sensor histidine kinase [Pseudomonas fulva]|uniref:ATP-binding protein n=1 Tax=Pseudomonas fulva TaxID=47880 RepID=UPI0015E31579|nr:sensor histidine kinase [Pseudomonas fulva]MBA1220844.1 sensor histidine kinase [Pseudomonas fulva]